ncbi:MAG: hypothetical protein ABIQ70_03520 [Dokdonella sp.]
MPGVPREIGLARALRDLVLPHVPREDEPALRRLQVYARDPTITGVYSGVARIEIPYEPLANGSALFAIDHEVEPNDEFVAPNLDDARYAINDGLSPDAHRDFMAQMVYAIAMSVHTTFSRVLGRPARLPTPDQEMPDPKSGKDSPNVVARGKGSPLRLRLRIDARAQSFDGWQADVQSPQELVNAFYDPAFKSGNACCPTVAFGVFTAADEMGATPYQVHTALSADVVAHELTHAVLDGERPYLGVVTSVETAALNEGLADLVALFLHFRHRPLLIEAIERKGGDLSDELIRDLASEFGRSIDPQTTALRRVIIDDDKPDSPPPRDAVYNALAEPHALGSVLGAAIFGAFRRVYLRRMHLLGKVDPGEMSRAKAELAAERLANLAEDFLDFALRGIDYLPPVHVTFSDYLRATITADCRLNPDDPLGFRDELIASFRRFRIPLHGPQHFNVESVRWPRLDVLPPVENLGNARPVLGASPSSDRESARADYANKRVRIAQAVTTWLDKNRHERDFWDRLGLCNCEHVIDVETVVLSADLARRGGPQRNLREEYVVQVIQSVPRKSAARSALELGGSTLIFDVDGTPRHAIHNPLCRVVDSHSADHRDSPQLRNRALGGATWPPRDPNRRAPQTAPNGVSTQGAALDARASDGDFAQRLTAFLAGPGHRYATALKASGADKRLVEMKRSFMRDTHQARYEGWFGSD